MGTKRRFDFAMEEEEERKCPTPEIATVSTSVQDSPSTTISNSPSSDMEVNIFESKSSSLKGTKEMSNSVERLFQSTRDSDEEYWNSSDEEESVISSCESDNSEEDNCCYQMNPYYREESHFATSSALNIENRLLGNQFSRVNWTVNNPGQPSFPFKEKPGLKIEFVSKKPIDYFKMLANKDLVNLVISETNVYGRVMSLRLRETKRTRVHKWVDLSEGEFYKFLAVLYLTGHIVTPEVRKLWTKNSLYDFPTVKRQFSRYRFLIILRALHFGSNPNEGGSDVLYMVKPLIDVFENNMKRIHYPQKELIIDESMVLWKGRLRFRHYFPNKWRKYGMKFYTLTQPDGLVCRLYIHASALDHDLGGIGYTEKVVRKLASNYFGKGHSIYMDEFYSSVPLAKYFLSNQTYVTGTLCINRACNPMALKEKLQKHQLVARYSEEGICAFKWHDKQEVTIISSEYDEELIETTSKRGITTRTPKALIQYNKYTVNVEKTEQIMAYYPVARKTLRWDAKLGLHIFHIIMFNSYLLYKANEDKNARLLDFRESVIESLLDPEEQPSEHKAYWVHLPKKSSGTRKKCRSCYKQKIIKNTPYVCDRCEDTPGLCLGRCFREYHNYP